MGARARELTRDIERTRDELGSTLEAVGDRVAPKKAAARAKAKVADKVEEFQDRASPKRVLERRTEGLRRGMGSARGSMTGSNKDMTDDDEASDESAISPASGTASGRAGRRLYEDRDPAALDEDHPRSAPMALRAKAASNPLLAGVVVFGGAVLLAAVLKRSLRAQQAARRSQPIEPVDENAVRAGRDATANLEESAQQGMEQAKELARGAAEPNQGQSRTSPRRPTKASTNRAAQQLKGQAQGTQGEFNRQVSTARRRVQPQRTASARTVEAEARRPPATAKAAGKRSTSRTVGAAKAARTTGRTSGPQG
ncbi:MAG: DUF3618 domain-containing protein [Actinomycetota bacterium]|nr:DUF3618 domain-containing protein [Actinomycetota bacterium]